MEAAALESEIVTNRIRGRDDDHIARSARDVADAADGSRPLPRSQGRRGRHAGADRAACRIDGQRDHERRGLGGVRSRRQRHERPRGARPADVRGDADAEGPKLGAQLMVMDMVTIEDICRRGRRDQGVTSIARGPEYRRRP